MSGETSTQEKLMHFGKQEFLHKGFRQASLRDIALAAGMTTGAIYTYFKDKNALFESTVAPVCAHVEVLFSELSGTYYTADAAMSEVSAQKFQDDLKRVYEMIYDDFDGFRLLVVGAEGSSRADYIHTIVNLEVMHTMAYLERLNKRDAADFELNPTMVHIITESFIDALLEPVRHSLSYEEAIANIGFLCAFFMGGWRSVLEELFE